MSDQAEDTGKKKFLEKFKGSKLNGFLNKVKEKAPGLGAAILNIAANPNPINVVQQIAGVLKGSDSTAGKELYKEFQKDKWNSGHSRSVKDCPS